MKELPNFFGIGGQKCASTWLSECLRNHPQIFITSPKEIKYFLHHEHRGLNWYLKFFKDSSNFKMRGEFASNYLYDKNIPSKIYKAFGQVKIIAIIRDPIARSLSHIKHLIRNGELNDISNEISLRQFIQIQKKYPEVLSNSLYHCGLKNFFETFGKDNIIVLDQAICKTDPDYALKILWDFLGIDDVLIKNSNDTVSAGIIPKSMLAERIRIKIFSLLRFNAPWVINYFRKFGISRIYRKLNNSNSDIKFSSEAIKYIEDNTAEDWFLSQSMASIQKLNSHQKD
jgi:hypothetical protein